MALPPFARVVRNAVQIQVRVHPGARSAGIHARSAEPDGSVRLSVAVTAPADRGRANAALIELLARTWNIPKSALSITAGLASRRKTVEVVGDPDALAARITAWDQQACLSPLEPDR